MKRKYIQPFAIGGLLLYAVLLSAQNTKAPAVTAPAASETDALIKATQNPVASMISVPLQNNSNFAVGPYNRTQDIFNIQPVIPKRISEDWFLITRVIQPFVWQPNSTQNIALSKVCTCVYPCVCVNAFVYFSNPVLLSCI